MKKRLLSMTLAMAMTVGLLAGCSGGNGGSSGSGKSSSWKVTCPWAPSGVAAMVSQKTAAKSTQYSDNITLVAEAIAGDAATVNTWVMDTKANAPELVFVGEGLLSITSIIDPAKLQFTQDDFVFVENLYSSIFVLSAEASLNIKTIADLEAYVAQGNEISVAVNGAVGSEAFLAASLFGKMGAGDKLKLVAYQSAAEAAQAVAKGIEGLKPGVTTELELYKSIARQGYLCGSEHFTFMSLVSGPERALCADCPPSDEVISAEPGTIIRVEGGAIRNELNAPFAANIVVGGVQPGQEPAWELAQDMISAAMAAVKPGAPASSVAAAMDACVEVQGKADWSVQPGYAGSGIGWGRIDGPLLSKNSKSVLRAGMALTLQASVRHSSLGMLILRQNVVVTEGGCAFLNGKTTEPLIV